MIETEINANNNRILCSIIIADSENDAKVEKTVNSLKKICTDSDYVVIDAVEKMPDALKSISSKYVNIIPSGSEYVGLGNTKLDDTLKVSANNILVANVGSKCAKNYPLRKALLEDYHKEIKIEEEPEKIWTRLETVFLKSDFLRKRAFDYSGDDFVEEIMLLTKLISENGSYSMLEAIEIETMQSLEYTGQNKRELRDSGWYESLFANIDKLVGENGNTKYVQVISAYLIKMAIWENMNSNNKGCLFGNDVQMFFDNCAKRLAVIEDCIIAGLPGTAHLNYYLAMLKHGGSCGEVQYRNNDIEVACNGAAYLTVSNLRVYIMLMEYRDGVLNIEMQVPFPRELAKQFSFYAQYNDDIIPFTVGDSYAQYKAFGETVYCWNPIAVAIPVSTNKPGTIKICCRNNEGSAEIKELFFYGSLSRLRWKNSYWVCDNSIITSRDGKIQIEKKTAGTLIKHELLYLIALIRKKEPNKNKALITRVAYFLTKPFFKKEIWLFEDKVFKGGDNGEYLFDYARKQNDGIKKYYVLSKGCIDADRFATEGKRYITFGSLKHRLLLLNCDIVFATHKDSVRRHGFEELMNYASRDKYNFSNVCIQHGLSVQFIPSLINRINDNIKGFFLASPIERQNVLGEEYGYIGHEDVLKITGCPRYDGLVNNDKRQILITPTWRNYLSVLQSTADEARGYSDTFKESDYFRIYNTLINNERLIECAKETGYKLIYLLHPATSSQIGDFDTNDYVELITATGNMSYEKVLTESSLMVTDYSGVQFDFAYMYKPIVYFQPDELPPSYDAGYYDYNTMALGDITKTVDETVEMICEYMKNECEIKPEYRKRVDDFFLYHDHNNCKRVYDEIMEMREKGEV